MAVIEALFSAGVPCVGKTVIESYSDTRAREKGERRWRFGLYCN